MNIKCTSVDGVGPSVCDGEWIHICIYIYVYKYIYIYIYMNM